MSGGDRTAIHDEQKDTLHRQAQAAGCRPVLEAAGVLRDVVAVPNGRRPADILLNRTAGIRTARGRPLSKIAIDVGVVCPQAPLHRSAAAARSGGAATEYTETKRNHNDTARLYEEAGVDYQPIVLETLGVMSAEACRTIRSINALVAENTDTSSQEVATRLWQRMSFDLQRSLHKAFTKRACNQRSIESRSQAYSFLNAAPYGG